MTDDELDTFFVELLNRILDEVKDCSEYLGKPKTKEQKEIKKDYDFVIKHISKLLKSVKSIDDLAEEDDDTIDSVYGYIEAYAENFVISADEPQKSRDLEEYKKIEEILDLFLDTDDFEDEEI